MNGIDITFQDMLNQWKIVPSKFASGLFKAKLKIGEEYVKEFKRSFDLKKAPGDNGRFWPLRKNEHRYHHELMNETGDLKDSISYQLYEGGGLIPQEHGLQTSNVNSWVTPLWLSLKRN